ncbi:NAD(P)-dependent oxidoreductase [Phaeobacter gallaeciensis]|uniref:dihydrouracil dehydrogenase (NAD(+)) n=1 Tax=Phaeobacter gallaeciensis TaxID=60890 RepID=A0AAC9Z9W7_9RHOB|nr:NAD(P)-dependent oxidoreductase [Phaeobacter gallaeciensis]AHD09871.1 NADPH-dependent glutamate synthase beta chain [Phaeobacter gallaeciensis DSM 26640]ATE93135.1 pyridine nucleotide-disulfide oxidoreductase-like protein [Phaeobacter gallaeciensis]ATE97043.1 pyridine nucleotide-disulfide oxidoreductase-like protein [Phaeobacter gallaeciensis]ATF01800.1 pyridine nucleotide-disulfide oxidoreductase-like protein [Phaeobacter gallaeciensis]ATF06180.1 pyridine nucleotide-disulfide oxidoreductas
MATSHQASGIQAGRLSASEIADNFGDLHPQYEAHEAAVAADRCYFCYDAPCMTACPTTIDIPQFIREIQTGHPEAAAKTILEQNILGGMCARVCPTETLCEEACVREAAEGKPVEIGRLQRHATDTLMEKGVHPFTRAAATGKRVAVVGAGPAGLAAAHRLAMLGNDVVIYEARPKAGGLNEFGIAAYKSTENFASREVDWLLQIGGITVEYGKKLGAELSLDALKADYDAVFLSIGLGGVNALRAEGEDKDGVRDAVDFIAELRQAEDLTNLPVGRNVVVIGGGMTAVDAAVQSKLLGSETVTIAYRRGRDAMGASRFEQDLAATKGVRLLFNVQPVAVHGNGACAEIELEYTKSEGGQLSGTGETVRIAADQIYKAIGQTLEDQPDALALEGRKIKVDGRGRTSLAGVWAGGDCASGGEDLTVTAVAEGRDAAMDIHASLMG